MISDNNYEEYFNENSRLHLSLFHLNYLFKGISCNILSAKKTRCLACYLERTSEILEGTLGGKILHHRFGLALLYLFAFSFSIQYFPTFSAEMKTFLERFLDNLFLSLWCTQSVRYGIDFYLCNQKKIK